ncbi:MAG: hypothetical protein AB8B65_04960 [Kordia sp.]|uniref:hypothetical protein n=1 Tax=Kordia sp. TaxID=1965332 RepID=UPI00385A9E4B
MKKIYLLLFVLGTTQLSFSQTIQQVDSISNVFCEYLKTINIKNDTLKLNTLYEQKFYPYLRSIAKEEVEKVGNKLYYRLQRNCVEFRKLLDRLEPPKDGLTRITEKPVSEITKKQLNAFKKQKEFYYYEASGEKTIVIMKDGFWTDYFSDDTASKLTTKWIGNTEFELTFIESDNETRANFSVKGDKYVYQVLAKKDNYYEMSVNIPGQIVFEKFKIYYK